MAFHYADSHCEYTRLVGHVLTYLLLQLSERIIGFLGYLRAAKKEFQVHLFWIWPKCT